MNKNKLKSKSSENGQNSEQARGKRLLLRFIWASQPISRAELARRIKFNRSSITEIVNPLISRGLMIGEYLGIGIANIIMGFGCPNIIVSGRLVYGWEFLRESLNEAINKSMAGKLENWSVISGEPVGASLGGALEIAVEDFFLSF